MANEDKKDFNAMLYILVREYRCSGGTETASPVEGNR